MIFWNHFSFVFTQFSASIVKISQILVKRLEDDFAAGSSRNYTRIQVDFFRVYVFLNLLTYSLTSTYAHSKQKLRKVWVKSAYTAPRRVKIV